MSHAADTPTPPPARTPPAPDDPPGTDAATLPDMPPTTSKAGDTRVTQLPGELMVLRGWQRLLLRYLLARRGDGRLAHRQALVGMGRKNGKSLANVGKLGCRGVGFRPSCRGGC
jgi:hypothetical protein